MPPELPCAHVGIFLSPTNSKETFIQDFADNATITTSVDGMVQYNKNISWEIFDSSNSDYAKCTKTIDPLNKNIEVRTCYGIMSYYITSASSTEMSD